MNIVKLSLTPEEECLVNLDNLVYVTEEKRGDKQKLVLSFLGGTTLAVMGDISSLQRVISGCH